MKKSFEEFIKKELSDSFVMITTGLPATGKTRAADEVVKIKHCPMLRSDVIRLEVLKGQDVFDENIAGDMNQRLAVYDELFHRANETIKNNRCVILDATFITQGLRIRAAKIAAENNKPFIIMNTECPENVAIARINRRSKENYESNAVSAQAYFDNARQCEPVNVSQIKDAFPALGIIYVTLDTSGGENNCIFITSIEKR
jgi:predicted kinase